MSETQKHTKPNVPNLRFPRFEGEWERIRVSDLLVFFSTNSLSWEQLEYGGKEILNLHYGLIHNGLPTQINLEECTLPSVKPDCKPQKYTLCKDGDVAFADASEDTNDVGKVVEFTNCADREIVCGLHTIHGRDKLGKTVPGFKGYAFSSSAFHNQIRRIAQGTKIFSINTGNFEESFISIPIKEEQNKIASLLSLIDQRIAIQNKVIEDLKKLKTALCEKFLVQISNSPLAELGKHCSITTGKLDANAMSESGKYMFFTCAKENYRTDTYAFEGDALLISGNGELGLCKYYSGKFNAYQRTYVLQNFDMDIQFAKLMIDSFLPRKIYREKNAGAMPYIVLSTLSELQIPVPDCEIQTHISTVLSTFANKIELEECVLTKLILMKNHILSQMFI